MPTLFAVHTVENLDLGNESESLYLMLMLQRFVTIAATRYLRHKFLVRFQALAIVYSLLTVC